MRNAGFILFGFTLLVLQSTLGVLIPLGVWAPNLLLPIALYLGVTRDVQLVRGAALSFLLGYLLDLFCGSPMGLQTFVLVAIFLIARGTGLNLFMRGNAFRFGLTFLTSMLAGGTILALRAIFEPPTPFVVDLIYDTTVSLVAGSLVTAGCALGLFAGLRRIDSLLTRRREEGSPA